MRHFNIPIFIPGLACPHQCIFCDQVKIASQQGIPTPQQVDDIVSQHIKTMPSVNRSIEIAFFGGSFTGLPMALQHQYLSTANQWVKNGQVDGIRLSTRPDYISLEIIDLMQQYQVSCIELGAQSLDEEVLQLSGRGHTVAHVEQAAEMILKAGIQLGLQMMIGLPGDSLEKALYTAQRIAQLGATNTRIYPTLVIKGTQLEQHFFQGSYQPLELEQAIEQCAQLLDFFEGKNIKVLRLGLHPSHDLLNEGDLVAGPWHPALKELALTNLWQKAFKPLTDNPIGTQLRLTVAPGQLNVAIGHNARNRKKLENHYRKVSFKTDSQLEGRRYVADTC